MWREGKERGIRRKKRTREGPGGGRREKGEGTERIKETMFGTAEFLKQGFKKIYRMPPGWPCVEGIWQNTHDMV